MKASIRKKQQILDKREISKDNANLQKIQNILMQPSISKNDIDRIKSYLYSGLESNDDKKQALKDRLVMLSYVLGV